MANQNVTVTYHLEGGDTLTTPTVVADPKTLRDQVSQQLVNNGRLVIDNDTSHTYSAINTPRVLYAEIHVAN